MRRHFGPEARIVGIMRPYLADVLAGTPWLDRQWFFDPHARDRRLHCWAVVAADAGRAVRPGRAADQLVSHGLRRLAGRGAAADRLRPLWPRPAVDGQALSPPRRPTAIPEPMVETYLGIARAIGCAEESPRLELATLPADERSADAVFGRLGFGGDGRVVAFNSSGAYGGSKLWPVEYFAQLARRIVDELDHDVLVFCGPKEREIAREIVRLSALGRVLSMADGPMDLGTAKACMRRCRLMVSTDSGPRHVAAAMGLPVVTLFGPMLPVWSENPTQQAMNLVLDLDCIGCHRRTCPLGHHRCMRDLTVDDGFRRRRAALLPLR